jgi:septal ring factor EnvC (AmiA/AmiB activator)
MIKDAMASITKEIESLRAKIARLEKEQKKAEQQEKALAAVQDKIAELLKENGLNLEAYVRSNYAQVSRIVAKIERERGKSAPQAAKSAGKKRSAAKKRRARGKKPSASVKIPAGKYGNVPAAPQQVFEVKEKGQRPKILKAYAEEIGLENFFKQCRLDA